MLKLLDYGKPNPFSGIIGRPRNLAWPVHAYRVTLPKVSNDGDGLNAFERVILKLLDVFGILNADELVHPAKPQACHSCWRAHGRNRLQVALSRIAPSDQSVRRSYG